MLFIELHAFEVFCNLTIVNFLHEVYYLFLFFNLISCLLLDVLTTMLVLFNEDTIETLVPVIYQSHVSIGNQQNPREYKSANTRI